MDAERSQPAAPAAEVAFALIPRFNMMSVTTALEPMRIANYLSPTPLYRWQYLSCEGGRVPASNGMDLDSQPLAASGAADIIFVCGSWGSDHYHEPALFSWLRHKARTGSTVIALELGIYPVARAGLLAGRAATTHWSCMPGFAEQFAAVPLSEQLYTSDGNIMTCAGGTATIDLVLNLISAHHGDQLAREVSDQIIHHPIRQPQDPQRRTMGGADEDIDPVVRAAIKLIEDNICEPVRIPEIAARLGLSQRQLERLFKRHLGCSAVQFSKLLRLQHARVLLTSTSMSIREVSAASGFNSLSYFSHAFLNCFGKKPSSYRRAWPDKEPAPTWPGTLFAVSRQLQSQNGAN